MTDIILSDVTVLSIDNPVPDVEVVTVGIPGLIGPQGPQGPAGQPNILTIGTVTTGAPGSNASASVSGASPNQVLSLVLPQGQQGPQGNAGPPPTLSIGTVTTGAAGTSAAVSIDGSAAPAYVLSFTIPKGADGGGVVAGGVAGDVLVKNSSTDFDTAWSTPTSASTASKIVKRDANGRASVVDPAVSTDIATKNYVDTGDKLSAPNVTSSTAYTFILADGSREVDFSATTAVTATVPPNSSVAYPVGTVLKIAQFGTGQVTIASGAGVTVEWGVGYTNTTRQLRSVVYATKRATDTWVLNGDLTLTLLDVSNAPTNPADLTRKDYVDGKTWPSTAISDSTATGRSVLTAADAATARTAIGAGTSSLAIGTTSTTAKAGDYQPTSANISDSTAVGRSVLTAVDAATARTAIGAGTSSLAIGTTSTTAKAGDYQPTSANITDAASIATVSVVIKRDAAGRAQVVDPSAAADISTKNYTDTQDAAMRRPVVNTQTASYTLALTDERKLVQLNSASATALTVPPNSSVAFPVGTVIDVQMIGAGTVTITPGAAVTLNLPDSLSAMTRQYSVVRLQKVATDTWNVSHIGSASATSSSTANTFMKRDASGRASVADPSASTDIATKNYVDGKLAGKITVGTTAPSSPATNDLWVDTN